MPSTQRSFWTGFGTVGGATSGWNSLVLFLLRYPQAGCLIGTLLLIAGAGCLATPECRPPADRADRSRRRGLLAASLMPTIALLVWMLTLRHVVFVEPAFGPPAVLPVLLATIGCVPFSLLLFFQLRSLAHRARNADLAEHCAIVGIGVAASLLVTAVIYCAAAAGWIFDESSWDRLAGFSLIVATILVTDSLLFYLWGGWLLIRFAVAFHRAALQARHDWRRDDRSAG